MHPQRLVSADGGHEMDLKEGFRTSTKRFHAQSGTFEGWLPISKIWNRSRIEQRRPMKKMREFGGRKGAKREDIESWIGN